MHLKKVITLAYVCFVAICSYAQPGLEKQATAAIIVKTKPIANKQQVSGTRAIKTYLADQGLPGMLKVVPLNRGGEVNQPLNPTSKGAREAQSSQLYVLEFEPSRQPVSELISACMATGLFEYAEPDYIGYGAARQSTESIPSDPFFSRQWYLENLGNFPLAESVEGADVSMVPAWGIQQGDKSVIVAILDTGLKLSHPEFSGRLWRNENEQLNGQDDDNNGFIDDFGGWDFVNGNNQLEDESGHGTHVTGVLAANGNNGTGYAGVDWGCTLMPLKVLNNELSGRYSWWIAAINYAVGHGASIINMSLGGETYSRALEEAVNYAHQQGVLVVASMQNFNTDIPYYPAAYTNSVAVGATGPDGQRSTTFLGLTDFGSNFGSHIDLVAPGDYIFGLSHISDVDFEVLKGGTSQSAPIVSGILALLKAQNPNMPSESLLDQLLATADDEIGSVAEDTPGWDPYYGFGRVNALRALATRSPELPLEDDFKLYPNPASHATFLSINRKRVATVEVTLVNQLGKIMGEPLFSGVVRQLQLPIQLDNLSGGLYFLVVNIDGKRNVKRLLLTR